jgi:hypothetical protein
MVPFTHCRQCGRRVKHPVAVKFGVGPVCAKKIQMTPNPYKQDYPESQEFTYSVLLRGYEKTASGAHKFIDRTDSFWQTKARP